MATQTNAAAHVPTNNTPDAKADELSDVENLIGYWFTPHAAALNISFTRDGNFLFNDFNVALDKDEILQGTYHLENGTLTLFYDDRPKQEFKFYKGEESDNHFTNYYIKKKGYYFVKGANGDGTE